MVVRRFTVIDSQGRLQTFRAYDPVDRLTRVTTPTGEVFTQSYDLAGRMLGRIAPNSTATDRSYEAQTGRLAEQTQSASDTLFNGFTYDYTDRGNIAEIAETGTLARTKRYSYDELERLTEVDVPEAPTENEAYTLDPEGNRITSQLSDTHETDVANRLTGDDAYSYVYDLNGNLISKTAKPGQGTGSTRPDWTYDYDDLDQLISVSRDGLEVERYRYDAFGRRSVIETANDNAILSFSEMRITAIANDGADRTIDLVMGEGNIIEVRNRYTHGQKVDNPLGLEVFGADNTFLDALVYHSDHLGTVRFLTNSIGSIHNSYEYGSYGRPKFTIENTPQPFRFTGREWDSSTELYYYRARYYDSDTGRFLQEDPLGFAGKDFNTYRYVGSNPLRYKDPFGFSAIESAGQSATASGLATSALNVGLRLDCLFTAISGAVEIAGSPGLESLDLLSMGADVGLSCGVKAKFSGKAAVQSRAIKKPKKPKKGCTATCMADANDNIDGNIQPGDITFAFATATAKTCPKARLAAKRAATHKLGKQPKHVQCKSSGK